jgi:hypothetical protein
MVSVARDASESTVSEFAPAALVQAVIRPTNSDIVVVPFVTTSVLALPSQVTTLVETESAPPGPLTTIVNVPAYPFNTRYATEASSTFDMTTCAMDDPTIRQVIAISAINFFIIVLLDFC